MLKKIITAIILVTLLFSTFNIISYAEEEDTYDWKEWLENSDSGPKVKINEDGSADLESLEKGLKDWCETIPWDQAWVIPQVVTYFQHALYDPGNKSEMEELLKAIEIISNSDNYDQSTLFQGGLNSENLGYALAKEKALRDAIDKINNSSTQEPIEEESWYDEKLEDVKNLDQAGAIDLYNKLTSVPSSQYTKDSDHMSKYVDLILTLMDSLGFKNIEAAGSLTERENLKDILWAIGDTYKDTDLLSADKLAAIEDKVDLTHDQTGQGLGQGIDIPKHQGKSIYVWPEIAGKVANIGADNPLSRLILMATRFLNYGTDDTVNYTKLQKSIADLHSILLQVGVGVAVIVGLVLAIKFMLAGISEKAEVKKMLGVYTLACVVIFGAFGIWKIIITILAKI